RLEQVAHEQRALRRQDQEDRQPYDDDDDVDGSGDAGLLRREIVAEVELGSNLGREIQARKGRYYVPEQDASGQPRPQTLQHTAPSALHYTSRCHRRCATLVLIDLDEMKNG